MRRFEVVVPCPPATVNYDIDVHVYDAPSVETIPIEADWFSEGENGALRFHRKFEDSSRISAIFANGEWLRVQRVEDER